MAPPHYIGKNARVENSSISEGCEIEGDVDYSVVFSNVTIEEGADVRYSVIMPEPFPILFFRSQTYTSSPDLIITPGSTYLKVEADGKITEMSLDRDDEGDIFHSVNIIIMKKYLLESRSFY